MFAASSTEARGILGCIAKKNHDNLRTFQNGVAMSDSSAEIDYEPVIEARPKALATTGFGDADSAEIS